VAKDTLGFPTVCSVGASSGIGSEGNGGSGSYDSKKGTKFGASQSVGSVGAVTAAFSGSTPASKASGALTVRTPVTGLGIGRAVGEKGQASVNASVQKGPLQVGVNARLGTIGDPKCRVP
jgi:hypothetical protein